MVRLQMATGMRPGEVCKLRPCDLERPWKSIEGLEFWLYRIAQLKNTWRGHRREIPLGPDAQEILAKYLERDPESCCFSPKESYNESGKGHPRLNDQWRPKAYSEHVKRACKKAGVEHWFPNQLRHFVGTLLQTELSQEDARCVLGHSTASTTARYAELLERAARAMAKLHRKKGGEE